MSIICAVNFDIAHLTASENTPVREATVEQKTAVLNILDPTMDEVYTPSSKAVALANYLKSVLSDYERAVFLANYLKSVLSDYETAVFTVTKEQHDAVHMALKEAQIKHLIKFQ